MNFKFKMNDYKYIYYNMINFTIKLFIDIKWATAAILLSKM